MIDRMRRFDRNHCRARRDVVTPARPPEQRTGLATAGSRLLDAIGLLFVAALLLACLACGGAALFDDPGTDADW